MRVEMGTLLEAALLERGKRLLVKRQALRSPATDDVFNRCCRISPEDLKVVNYPRRSPIAAFNPGALLNGDRVYIFPRLIFDYHSYVSSVGLIEAKMEDLLADRIKRPLETRIILWPQHRWEISQGCEDARAFNIHGNPLLLYTAVGKPEELGDEDVSLLAVAEFTEGFELKKRDMFKYTFNSGEGLIPNKDSTFIWVNEETVTLLTRPSVPGLPDMCWRGRANLAQLLIHGESLWPVLSPEPWELKTGWSTNAVQLSQGRHLVGWHAVLKKDLSYRNGLAIVNQEGELLAISDYLLAPSGLAEEYGDRPLVLFGNGLLVYKGYLVWVGGVSDYAMGVFVADLEVVLNRIKKV